MLSILIPGMIAPYGPSKLINVYPSYNNYNNNNQQIIAFNLILWLMKTSGSMPYSLELSNNHNISRMDSIPHTDTYFFNIYSNIVLPYTPQSRGFISQVRHEFYGLRYDALDSYYEWHCLNSWGKNLRAVYRIDAKTMP